jgi:adenylylsulfate kinase
MPAAAAEPEPGFALWITGLPASGKSTLTAALRQELAARGIRVVVLESDALREALGEGLGYDEDGRRQFYRMLAVLGTLLTRHGIPVLFDATANLRAYRDWARQSIPRFEEVYVDVPLETCMARDPKGIYKKAREGAAARVPGLQEPYEAPEHPRFVVHGISEAPLDAAVRIASELAAAGWLK